MADPDGVSLMPLFGPKKPCPSCGKEVKEPHSAADFLCPHCHQPGPWASPEQAAGWHAEQAARATYTELLNRIASGADPAPIVGELKDAATTAGYELTELATMNAKAIDAVARAALVDDLITPEEDAHIAALTNALNVSWAWLEHVDPSLPSDVLIAQINGGVLPEVSEPHIIAHKGEIVHFETNASLMKEVAIRQYQGGYSGISVPIGKTGVRYKIGGVRGHSVEVGTQMNVADSGLLAVTNKRVLYSGARKTVDMALTKLVNLAPFPDGLIFHVSNRVNAVIFRIPKGAEVVAAIVTAAAQRLE
jgi:hypothetical protein